VSLVAEVRGALEGARSALAGTAAEPRLAALAERLDEPLRVAIAGRVKAGKSTLLNALVGQELAPTDAGECTRIVTWYRDGVTYRVTLYPREGEPVETPFSRDGGALLVQLGGRRAEDVDRLVVDWPSSSLRTVALIDTPGIASASLELAERTERFLTGDGEEPAASDAVLYLMHHLHGADVRFLDAFRDRDVSHPAPINTVAVLSRADEIGAGKLDAMETASRIARRYREHPKVRTLCQTVVPVAALLAQAGETLEEQEFKALARVAAAPTEAAAALLLSADRFLAAETEVPVGAATRAHLLRRLGLFGVRLAVTLIARGEVRSSQDLSTELVRRSGLVELRGVLLSQFAGRRDVLKARAALQILARLADEHPGPVGERLAAAVERITAGAHEFAEIRLLNAHRAGLMRLRPEEAEELERLLGADGPDVAARLGLPADAYPTDLRSAAQEAMARWQTRAENPLSSREASDAARVLVRTCEGMLAALGPGFSG
jgi:50S ribosome-binding GTPase